MNTLTVAIKQDRIDNATRLNMANPMTKAIGWATGRLGCYIIGKHAFDAGTKLFTLSPEMADWHARWMAGENLAPATFTVAVADGVIDGTETLHDDSED